MRSKHFIEETFEFVYVGKIVKHYIKLLYTLLYITYILFLYSIIYIEIQFIIFM